MPKQKPSQLGLFDAPDATETPVVPDAAPALRDTHDVHKGASSTPSQTQTPAQPHVPVQPQPPVQPQARPLLDAPARAYATDPRRNVVLEASAGTGKTTVLVQRYVNLLGVGVDPANILAITFTRKAAAEMRERIIAVLRKAAVESADGRARWLQLRDRLGDIAISTIDAFCYGLLREFPLEAGLDPAFTLADETEVARLIEEALDHALRVCRGLAREDHEVALVFARLTAPRLRLGLSHLLERRLVAQPALQRYLTRGRGPKSLTIEEAVRRACDRMRAALEGLPGGLPGWLADGPGAHPRFRLLAADLRALNAGDIDSDQAGADADADTDAAAPMLAAIFDELRAYFLTKDGEPRRKVQSYKADHAASKAAWKRHVEGIVGSAPSVKQALDAWSRDLNVILARGIRRMLAVTMREYHRTLTEHGVVDFSEVLGRAVTLLRQMDEFSQSRYRLESRYHHVLVDEFQDTNRMQWELVSLLVKSWGEGFGLVHEAPLPPSLFLVGDRKQSIYRFRDADVGLLDEAATEIEALRPEGSVRRYISQSFRSVPELLQFVNDICIEVAEPTMRPDAFRYDERDRFPIEDDGTREDGTHTRLRDTPLRVIAADTIERCAADIALEIERLLAEGIVRDRDTGVARGAQPGDIAILFRSRESHRELEEALDARGIPSYVYKGLGFFDADEIKDLSALLRYLAAPESNLRAAAFLRSRFVRISDRALLRLGPHLAAALRNNDSDSDSDSDSAGPAAAVLETLDAEDRRVLEQLRASLPGWLALVDRLPPAEVMDHILATSAYGLEIHGARGHQARENVKKMRGLVRRIQNRGYATLGRLAEHLDRLSAGDEANAIIEAIDAVSLMTVHASKGLEFPIVFLVNLARGVAAQRPPIRVQTDEANDTATSTATDTETETETGVSVSVESFISEADTLEPAKEREETKRLLYVALTRARDTLYLSTLLKDGAFKATPGSLGSVLPTSLGLVFESAARASRGARLTWSAVSGRPHELLVASAPTVDIDPPPVTVPVPVQEPPSPSPTATPITTSAPHNTAWRRVGATSLTLDDSHGAETAIATAAAARPDHRWTSADAQQALIGRLVHRLFHARVSPEDSTDALIARAARLLRPDERVSPEETQDTSHRAATLFRQFAARDDLRALLDSGVCLFEVPFSLCLPADTAADTNNDRGLIVRGTIDCLVQHPDRSITIVEFKTGVPHPSHERQLALYVQAASALFPDTPVSGRLFHPA